MRWHDSYDAMISVASWAIDTDRLVDRKDVLHFFEKPWHYDNLYDDWRTSLALEEVVDMATMADVGLPVYLRDADGDLWDPDQGGLVRPGCSRETCFEPATASVDGENLCANHLVEVAHTFAELKRDLKHPGLAETWRHAAGLNRDLGGGREGEGGLGF